MTAKMVFSFSERVGKNPEESAWLLGNKGAQLSEMARLKVPVPSGFTIGAAVCRSYFSNTKKWPLGLEKQLAQKLKQLERETGKRFGSVSNPLLVSVRSGSFVSMPGMMETVLNLGLNDETVKGLAKKTGDGRMAFDSYRRLIQMFSDVVLNVPLSDFEQLLHRAKKKKKAVFDHQLDSTDLQQLIAEYQRLVHEKTGKPFPQDSWQQLRLAINAVFDSFFSERAVSYRRINNLPSDAGTAVTIQAMVFGNLGEKSGTGVGFTRNPSTGKKEFFGEFLMNAQGEDVVAGIRTPLPLTQLKKTNPKLFEQLFKTTQALEKHYKDMQDFEFTIENGKLFLLQTRSGKRTAQAAVKIAVDMVKEKMLSKEEAIMRIQPNQLNQLLHKQLNPESKKDAQLLAKGLAASPGAAIGKAVFRADAACHAVSEEPSAKVILVRTDTSPEDIEGMNASQGILTATGGVTSHASVVARGMGKCCVSGCSGLEVNETQKRFLVKKGNETIEVHEGDFISLDGNTGEVFLGALELQDPSLSGDFVTLMKWADSFRKLEIRTNADTPKDAKKAREFGAEGIGLCRTEHMFFEGNRIQAVREMILSDSLDGRKKALEKILPFQRQDFEEIFTVMNALPVIIRLLDPPLHEFLPKEEADIQALSIEMNVPIPKLKEINASLHEFNPMLGFRGVRLGIVYPEITEMQVRAIFEAALNVQKKGIIPLPEIEIPLVGFEKEFELMQEIIERVALELNAKGKIKYKTGSMIEVPRGALLAGELAKKAEFFSFGTNDLTQTTLGFSRDDAGRFIPHYQEKKVFETDPFVSIDQNGVGQLMRFAVEAARKTNPKVNIGICGEHGGEPASVEFCHRLGLDNVSCSPYRVPVARLAAAQAAIWERGKPKRKRKRDFLPYP
jgi:pyruvate,orthophosphate dikinase